MSNINPSIFKAYDIRGRFPEEFNQDDIEQIVGSYLSLVSQKLNKEITNLTIAVAKDIRTGSEIIHKKAIELMVMAGVKVYDFDLTSVNDLYFAVGYYDLDGGLMATASHNPIGYAGIKMTYYTHNKDQGLNFINGEEIKTNLQPITTSILGSIEKKNLFNDHINWLLSNAEVNKIKPLKVVVDTGGGMNILLLKDLFKQLPVQPIFVNEELDATFSKRAPNPLEVGATDTAKKALIDNQADLGVVYDVDGDRFFMIDEKGELIKGDMTLLVVAEHLLKKLPGKGIVHNVICSRSVAEKIRELGGQPIRSKVGYKNLSDAMKNNNGIMSGEVSSHFAFSFSWFADSAFLATLFALEAISEANQSLSKIVAQNMTWFRADEVNIKVENTREFLDKAKTIFNDGDIDELDGVTINYHDWWFNIRGSNTEPLIRITVETKDKTDLENKKQLVLEKLNLNQ